MIEKPDEFNRRIMEFLQTLRRIKETSGKL